MATMFSYGLVDVAAPLVAARFVVDDQTCRAVDEQLGPLLVTLGWAEQSNGHVSASAVGRVRGVLVACDGDVSALLAHLRALMRVQSEDGRELFFRYYDPDVLRILLPTCSPDQLAEIFGPISALCVPASDDADRWLLFRRGPEGLVTTSWTAEA